MNIDIKEIRTVELYNVLDILILYDKTLPYITDIVYELCRREFETFSSDDMNLKRITNYIKQLKLQNKFSKDKFYSLCKDSITMDNLWWLDQSNIIHFEEYCAMKPTSYVVEQLKTLIITYVDSLFTSESKQIEHRFKDIFMKSVLAANSHTSKTVQTIYNELVDDALNELIMRPNDAKLIGFVKICNTDLLHSNLIKDNCNSIILRLASYENNEKSTIFDVIEKQEMWATKHFDNKTLDLYFELIKRCSLMELFELVQEIPEDKINFSFLLITIAVFINKVPDSYKQLKSVINRNLQSLFNDKSNTTFNNSFTNSNLLLLLISIIRQACLEFPDPESSYAEWFTSTIGSDSVMRCGNHAIPWTLLLGTLASALPHEPDWVLRVHSVKALRAPAMCNRDAQGYKEACREKLTKIKESNSDSEDFC